MIISIVNNKGGVGKTTATVSLAHALVRKKQRVLVVDLDTQCNAGDWLMQKNAPVKETVYELFADPEADIKAMIYPSQYTGLDVLANTSDTGALEPALLNALPESYHLLKRRLSACCREKYDITLIDCPPNMGYFVMSSLYASDFVIVPILAGSAFSIEGLKKALEMIFLVQKSGNTGLKFLRLLINQIDRRTSMCAVTLDQIRRNFSDDQVFETVIPVNASFQKAEDMKQSIIRHNPACPGAKAYRSLAVELLDIIDRMP